MSKNKFCLIQKMQNNALISNLMSDFVNIAYLIIFGTFLLFGIFSFLSFLSMLWATHANLVVYVVGHTC